MRAPRREWTDEHLETLKTMWASGATAVAIGIATGGRGEHSVREKVSKLGLPRRPMGRQANYGLLSRGRALGQRRSHAKDPTTEIPRAIARAKQAGAKLLLETPFEPIAFTDIRSGQCRWIDGDPCGPETLYCGRPTEKGSYCPGHHRIAFRPVEVR